MDKAFGKFMSSSLFTFQVGPGKHEFTVHSSPLASLSPALDRLLNGTMAEAKTKKVSWPDVDFDTFIRLCEYAYRGDYTPPSFHKIPDPAKVESQTDVGDGAEDQEELNKALLNYPNPNKKKDWTRYLRDSFSRLQIGQPYQVDTFQPKGNINGDEDFTPVILGHAKLYIVADKYCIEPPCKLALYKLYQTLRQYKLWQSSVTAMIELARFVYSDAFRNVSGIKPLRDVALRYLASVLKQIGQGQGFRDLLAEGGDFTVEF